MPVHPEHWLKVTQAGLACIPGGFVIDPPRPVPLALITHGHADHARPGHDAIIATPETVAIMRARYGAAMTGTAMTGTAITPVRYGDELCVGETQVSFHPAGHVLGSAQIAITHAGSRVVVSGDYKRRRDPTCPPFEPVHCDVFVTEATFGLPVFRHPDDAGEVEKLLAAQALYPDRCILVGVYALGKAQRLIRLLREAGWERPIYIHGALAALCALYERQGVPLGPLLPVTGERARENAALKGQIVLAPPSTGADAWTRRLPDPVFALASGWMRVRQRAKQRGVELPLIISDHADWDELLATLRDTGAGEVWVTHGREEALMHQARVMGLNARALALIGREEEGA